MKRRRIILGVVFVVLLAGLGWLMMRQTAVQTFTLPDGSLLYLRGVTVGSNVPMHFGSAFEKMMGKAPGKWGRKFRRNEWVDESTSEELVFWFEFQKPPRSNSLVEVDFIDPAQRRQFQAHSWLPVQTLPNGRVIATCGFPVWPRQERLLSVQIDLCHLVNDNTDEGERHLLGRATVKNPGYRR